MDERTNSFGYWLRRRRKALDLTQESLAPAVACSRFAIRKIEADERRPSKRLAERLADKLALDPRERTAFLNAARHQSQCARLEMDRQPIEVVSHTRGEQGELVPFVGRRSEYGLLAGLVAHLITGAGHAALVSGNRVSARAG